MNVRNFVAHSCFRKGLIPRQSAATQPGICLEPMQVPTLSSRPLVAVPASSQGAQTRLRSRKKWRFVLLLSSNRSNLRTKGPEFPALQLAMSFVFKHFLASCSQLSCNYLYFQLLLSFVPALAFLPCAFSITYWLRSYFFYLSSIPSFPQCRDLPDFSHALGLRVACLRQYVHSVTTVIGYHRARGLSSGK
jgi:hypothetical protein